MWLSKWLCILGAFLWLPFLAAMDGTVQRNQAPVFSLGQTVLGAGQKPESLGYYALASFSQITVCHNQRVLVPCDDGSYVCGMLASPPREIVADTDTELLVYFTVHGTVYKKKISWKKVLVHASWNARAGEVGCFAPAAAGIVCGYQKLSEWVRVLPALVSTRSVVDSSLFVAACKHLQSLYLQQLQSGAWYERATILRSESPAQQHTELLGQDGSGCYVQKLHIQDADAVYVFGDIHGDVHSLVRSLQKLQQDGVLFDDLTLKKNNYLVFLGDYGDRGMWGAEVLYILFTLKSKNFDQVILVRGNHENKDLNESFGGLGSELAGKFGFIFEQRQNYVYAVYDSMPVALYLGCSSSDTSAIGDDQTRWVLCCHGGPELGFCPRDFLRAEGCSYSWLSKIDRSAQLASLPAALQDAIVEDSRLLRMQPFVPKTRVADTECVAEDFVPNASTDRGLSDIGFLWNDFLYQPNAGEFQFSYGRGCAFGAALTKKLMERDGVSMIVRGHQHSGTLYDALCFNEGCAPLFDGAVYTVLSGNLSSDDSLFEYAFIKLSRCPEQEPFGWDVDLPFT